MKNVLIFIAGVITGVVLLLLISLFLANRSSDNGMTFFQESGECISENSFKVFQVLDSGSALAREMDEEHVSLSGVTVLLLNEEGQFYDDQIIKIPTGKCAKQVGIYKYKSNGGLEKTVPIVEILNK